MRKLLLPLIAIVAACSNPGPSDASAQEGSPPAPEADPGDAVGVLREHVTSFAAQQEHDAARVTVQHLLVSFQGAVPGVQRSQEEAEVIAAGLWQQIQDGADFDALVKEHTDDSHPGIYTMVKSGGKPPTTYDRGTMVPAFGNAGWRLEVDEIGVAGFHPKNSPFGWHIVKRTE